MTRASYVKSYVDFLKYIYGFKVKDKSKSTLMKICAWFLNLFGFMSKEKFMEGFTVTIGNTIYIPFEVGNFNTMPYKAQLAIFPHELKHVFQYREEGWKYCFRYLSARKWTAKYEMEAYAVTMDFRYNMFGQVMPVFWLANKMKAYSCNEQIAAAANVQQVTQKALEENDGPVFSITITCIDWLKSHEHLLEDK